MGVENVAQWRRHQAAIQHHPSGIKVVCGRCGIELPLSLTVGQIVLSKEDRLFLGDQPQSKNCQ